MSRAGSRFIAGLSIINEQPHDIEHAAEPGYDKNDVKSLYVVVHTKIPLPISRVHAPIMDECSGKVSSRSFRRQRP